MEESFFWDEIWWNEIYLPQENGSREHLKIAQQYFQLVFFQIARLYLILYLSKSRLGGAPASATQFLGGSAWLPASFFSSNSTTFCFISTGWLLIDFGSAQHWCSSIKSYYYNDDVFNFDYGQAKAAVGNFQVCGFLRREKWSKVLYCWFHLMFLNQIFFIDHRRPRRSSWTSPRRSWSPTTLTCPGSQDVSLWMERLEWD